MNCKPGVAAYIVKDPFYSGRVVEVLQEYGTVDFSICSGMHWLVSASWKMPCENGLTDIFIWPDSRLVPISGVPLDDETPIATNVPEAVKLAWGIESPALT